MLGTDHTHFWIFSPEGLTLKLFFRLWVWLCWPRLWTWRWRMSMVNPRFGSCYNCRRVAEGGASCSSYQKRASSENVCIALLTRSWNLIWRHVDMTWTPWTWQLFGIPNFQRLIIHYQALTVSLSIWKPLQDMHTKTRCKATEWTSECLELITLISGYFHRRAWRWNCSSGYGFGSVGQDCGLGDEECRWWIQGLVAATTAVGWQRAGRVAAATKKEHHLKMSALRYWQEVGTWFEDMSTWRELLEPDSCLASQTFSDW